MVLNFDENNVPLNLSYTNGSISDHHFTINVTAGEKSAVFETYDEITGVIIVRLYDYDDELIDIKIYNVTECTVPFNVVFTTDKTGANVDVLWWYDTDKSMQPVCGKKILE